MKRRKLKIAQIAPLVERIPPKKYGGTERVINALTEELVLRGHDVTLFATGDSQTSADLFPVYPRSLREAKVRDIYGANELTMLNVGVAYSKQGDFDIIHDHLGNLSINCANMAKKPVLMTLHGAITINSRKLFETFGKPRLVTISDSQAAPAPNLNYVGTVYNGLDMKNYPYSGEHDGYLLYVGRISMEKGVHLAIQVAQNLNIPLVIAAKLDEVDRPYFEQYIRPNLSNGYIKWIGEVDEVERNKLMSRAMCFLHPITWREPFGLTLIESMACGCPVIAFNKGSASEIVVDGKTGFVCDDVEAMIDDVEVIDKINREDCRKHALSNFNAEKMTDGYEKIYYEMLEDEESWNVARAKPNGKGTYRLIS